MLSAEWYDLSSPPLFFPSYIRGHQPDEPREFLTGAHKYVCFPFFFLFGRVELFLFFEKSTYLAGPSRLHQLMYTLLD